jgi:hypothetical protein
MAKPASEGAIRQLIVNAGIELPSDYIAFLSKSNGGEGELGVEPGWFRIWEAEETLANNADYSTDKYVPEFFAFGSSGGGEMFAFDLREGHGGEVVMIPFVPMNIKDARKVARNFTEFASWFGRVLSK